MTEPALPLPDAVDPLRERLPIYGKLFTIGVAAAVLLGLLGWVVFVDDPEPPRPLTYSEIKNAERWLGTNPSPASVEVFLSPPPPGEKTTAGVAIGYATIGIGTLLLLVGGARGGGYTNLGLGAVEAVVGGRNRTDDDYEEDEELRRGAVMKRRDPMERLRKGGMDLIYEEPQPRLNHYLINFINPNPSMM